MSNALYPDEVWSRFSQPKCIWPGDGGALVAEVSTPASQEHAALFELSGRWYWRAHASPWLTAALERLCELGPEVTTTELDEALKGLQIPPIKRYCAVLVRELCLRAQAQ